MVIVTKRGDRISAEIVCCNCGSELIYFPRDTHLSSFDEESMYLYSGEELKRFVEQCDRYITCPLCDHEIQVS